MDSKNILANYYDCGNCDACDAGGDWECENAPQYLTRSQWQQHFETKIKDFTAFCMDDLHKKVFDTYFIRRESICRRCNQILPAERERRRIKKKQEKERRKQREEKKQQQLQQ